MTCCVIMATFIYFYQRQVSYKVIKAGKSHETCLTNHTQPILHHITPLVINAFGGGYTDTQTHTQLPKRELNQFQETIRARLLAKRAWFKKPIIAWPDHFFPFLFVVAEKIKTERSSLAT